MTDKEIEKEFGYEDMEEDWDDDLSEVIDIEEENDYYEDDDLDYGECDYEDELNVQETELPKGKRNMTASWTGTEKIIGHMAVRLKNYWKCSLLI